MAVKLVDDVLHLLQRGSTQASGIFCPEQTQQLGLIGHLPDLHLGQADILTVAGCEQNRVGSAAEILQFRVPRHVKIVDYQKDAPV